MTTTPLISCKISKSENFVFITESKKLLIIDDIQLEIIDKFFSMSKVDFLHYVSNKFPNSKQKQILNEVKKLTKSVNNFTSKSKSIELPTGLKSFDFKLSNLFFSIYYEDIELINTVIGQLHHLQCDLKKDLISKKYYVFRHKTRYYLNHENYNIGSWEKNEIHFLTGKLLSMIMCDFHKLDEQNWSAFLHASSVSKNNSCFLVVGESGNGKSTSCAILSNNGFKLITDDITPIKKNGSVGNFPNSISVKSSAYDKLRKIYPEKMFSDSFNLDKGEIKFLNPNNSTEFNPLNLSCSNLIWVKYQPNVKNSTNKVSRKEVLSLIVNDSFFPLNTESVQGFMNWFVKCNCYELVYHDDTYLINFFNQISNN